MIPPEEASVEAANVQLDIGPFLPLLLLITSLLIVFIWQLTNVSEQRGFFRSTIVRQDEPVKQSRQLQANLERLVVGLLELAKAGDAESVAIVKKYNIQQTNPVGTAPPR